MKHAILIAIASVLLPSAGHAEEKPLWEIRGRLDGGKNPRINGLLKQILTATSGPASTIGDKAAFRVAVFENAATPEGDWIAEVRDLADSGAFIKQVEAGAKPDGQGRFLMERDGKSFLVWQEGNSVLHFAGPPQNAGITVTPAVTLSADSWLSGWIDLSRVSEEVESRILKVSGDLSFSLSSAGEGVNLDLDAGLGSKESALVGKTLLEELMACIAADKERAAKIPPVVITAEDHKLKVKVGLSDALLDELIGEAAKAFKER